MDWWQTQILVLRDLDFVLRDLDFVFRDPDLLLCSKGPAGNRGGGCALGMVRGWEFDKCVPQSTWVGHRAAFRCGECNVRVGLAGLDQNLANQPRELCKTNTRSRKPKSRSHKTNSRPRKIKSRSSKNIVSVCPQYIFFLFCLYVTSLAP